MRRIGVFHPGTMERLPIFTPLLWSCLKYVYPHTQFFISTSHPRTQILTGTAPFPRESDQEIVDKVVMGLRPEWSSISPPQGLADALWYHIRTCWRQEPEGRPTASKMLETLLVLSETYPYQSESDSEPLVPSLSTFKPLHDDGEHAHGFSHLPQDVTTEAAGGYEPVAHPTEIVDQREGRITIGTYSSRVPYLISQPIPEGKTLRKVVITITCRIQGQSSLQIHPTYFPSWTWFELSVGSPESSSGRWCGEVFRSSRAHDFKKHTVKILDEELYEKAKGGDVLTVWALARRSGWRNTVENAAIRYIVE